MNKKLLQRNWWVLLIILVCIFAYIKRNTNFFIPIVSNPDNLILFSTVDIYVEQTWQPCVKKINSINLPYRAQNEFDCDIQLTISNDDYSQRLIQLTKRFAFSEEREGVIEFDFDAIDVIIGERYHVQFCFQDVSQKGSLEFPSGSNYGGSIIGESEMNEALALQMGGVKRSGIFWLVAALFPLGSISLFLMIFFRCKWEETVGVALILEVLLLYIFGLFGHIKWGIYSINLFSLVVFGIAIYFINRKKIPFNELLSSGLWIFGIILILIILGNEDTWYGRFDEYSHWGLAVKDMFYYDSFAKHVDTTVLIPRYLPFVTLFEYYYTYLNGVYVEKVVYIAFQVIMLCFSIIMSSSIRKNRIAVLPVVLGMVCIPPIFFDDVTNCIYVDPLLGIVAMYVLICFYKRNDTLFSKVQIILGLIALVLVKDMGVVLGGLLALIFIVDAFWANIKEKRNIFYQLTLPTLSVLIVILTWLSWQIFMALPVLSKNNIDSSESTGISTKISNVSFTGTVEASGISLNGILELITGRASNDQKQVIKNFIIKVFDSDMYYIGNVGFSYIDIMAICILVVGMLYLLQFFGKNSEKMLRLILLLSIVGIIYCGVLSVLYLFAFPIDEALKLKSIERYLGSFMVAEMMFIWYFIIAELCNRAVKDKRISLMAVFMSLGLLIVVPMENFIVKNKDRSVTADMVYWYEGVEEIFRSFAKRGEYSAFECANGGTESYFIFRNAVSPLLAERTNLNIVSSEELAEKQVQWYIECESEMTYRANIVTQDEWINYLRGCDYLFVLHADVFFINSYKAVFLEPETISDGSIYRVQKSDGDVSLSYIGKTGIRKYR